MREFNMMMNGPSYLILSMMMICFISSFIIPSVSCNHDDDLAADPQRPQYHFLPPQWWINDPNGPVYFNDLYHLFYQYTPNSTNSGLKYWGHAYSKDLAKWTHLPVAISPTPGSYDENGIWTGSSTITNLKSGPMTNFGPLYAIYTGINQQGQQVQCIAFPKNASDPLLLEWVKYDNNPVLGGPPFSPATGFRDPTTAWYDDVDGLWRMVVGSGVPGSHGMTLLYESKDTLSWTYAGYPLYDGKPPPFGDDMFECPDFYPVSPSLHLLKVSTTGRDMWVTGSYKNSGGGKVTFTPTGTVGTFDFGDFYASKSFYDTKEKRRVTWGWVLEEDGGAASRGWAGMFTLPRVVTIDPKTNIIRQNPVDSLSSLRGPLKSFSNVSVEVGSEIALPLNGNMQGDQIEMLVTIDDVASSTASFTIRVRSSGGSGQQQVEHTDIIVTLPSPPSSPEVNMDRPGADYHLIVLAKMDANECRTLCEADPLCVVWTAYQNASGTPLCTLKNGIPNAVPRANTITGLRGSVTIDRGASSLASDAAKGSVIAPVIGQPSTLRVFIDHSVIEVYINGGLSCMTTRVYPTLPSSQGVSLLATGGNVKLSVNIWSMGSIF
eukprot:TRINITY_DN12964_c0_g1_i1.p1 TRINITY_DN12964_c0_g1~~TRINITY_DN12964_c0_g1_i1.p1  ORF type:complete len:604 (-),score=108.21 TRINITY_DN12964_c0_g1_i1:22-1833(-)